MCMKRILLVVSNLKVGGGAEKSVSLLAKGLSSHYDVSVLTFYDFKDEYDVSVKRYSFGFKYSDSMLKKMFRILVLFPLKLRSFLKQHSFDLVISNAEDANVVSLLCKRIYSYPLWTVIRNDICDASNVYYRFRGFHKWSDKNIVLTQEFAQKFSYPCVVIPNALEVSEISRLKSEAVAEKELFKRKTILLVGRLSAQKNHEWFFDVVRSFSSVNVLVIGSGPLEGILRSIAPPNVHFLGLKKNVYVYMSRCTVFVLPSLYEGMPRVLMEALACGCRCVVQDFKTGARELLGVGLSEKVSGLVRTEYGYLVEFNNKKAFKEALTLALRSKRKIMSDSRFELDEVVNMWRKEIEKKI